MALSKYDLPMSIAENAAANELSSAICNVFCVVSKALIDRTHTVSYDFTQTYRHDIKNSFAYNIPLALSTYVFVVSTAELAAFLVPSMVLWTVFDTESTIIK